MDPAAPVGFVREFGWSGLITGLLLLALWRYALPLVRELVEGHRVYLDRTAAANEQHAANGAKQTELLGLMNGKVDELLAGRGCRQERA